MQPFSLNIRRPALGSMAATHSGSFRNDLIWYEWTQSVIESDAGELFWKLTIFLPQQGLIKSWRQHKSLSW